MKVRQKFWLISYTFSRGNGAYWMMTLDEKPHTGYVRDKLQSDGYGNISITGITQITPETFRDLNIYHKSYSDEAGKRGTH